MDKFQDQVTTWVVKCFGAKIAGDRAGRNHRFLEEALELVQACGCAVTEARQLVEYVFNRPVGERLCRAQEVGDVLLTLAALCAAQSINMSAAAESGLRRAWIFKDEIRARQAAKPTRSPLPQEVAAEAPTKSSLRIVAEVLGERIFELETLVTALQTSNSALLQRARASEEIVKDLAVRI